MKRMLLLVATNVAVMIVLSIVAGVFGLDNWLQNEGIDYTGLLMISAVFGFGGAFISLLLSKTMAKWQAGVHLINGSEGSTEYWLVNSVKQLAEKAGIGMPEVGIFEGAPNAFATGAFRDSSLVAVSSGLIQTMSKEEVEAVLGHEIAHVANGDMVTLTLIQGVMNTFVFFLARVVGMIIDRAVFRNERGTGMGYWVSVMLLQFLFGILAAMIVAWFSRWREFGADRGSAGLLGSPRPMIAALSRLGQQQTAELPPQLKAFGIAGPIGALLATHPPIEQRIAALQASAQ
ncbi:MAG TPA: protease HtpX [Burkholderiales bacterium]|jgi:heat shock protein HtpX|nr:protease HtpX [Burkholderiales bacterium]